jgi:tetratricopeptide (TPR) repeat protein
MESKALSLFQQAREIQMSKLGVYGDVIDSTNQIGGMHMKLGAYNDALTVLRKNYDAVMKSIPEDTDRAHDTLYLIADAYEANGQIQEAIKHLKLYSNGICCRWGRSHLNNARPLQRLGNLALKCKEYDDAMAFLTEALAIRREHFERTGMIETLTSLSALSRLQTNYDAAINYLLEAYDITKDYQNYSDHCQILLELGYTYRLLSDLTKAHEVYHECGKMIEKSDKGYVSVLMASGHVKLAQRDYLSASSDYKLALQHFRENLDADDCSSATLKALRSIGLASYFYGNFDNATEHFQNFLSLSVKCGNASPIDLILVHLFGGDVLYSRQAFEEASESWNCAHAILMKNAHLKIGTTAWIVSMINDRLHDNGGDHVLQKKFESEIFGLYLVEEL